MKEREKNYFDCKNERGDIVKLFKASVKIEIDGLFRVSVSRVSTSDGTDVQQVDRDHFRIPSTGDNLTIV